MKKLISTTLTLALMSTCIISSAAESDAYYNAYVELDQVKTQIRYGDYLGAMQNCDQTMAWHTLSPEDIANFTELRTTADQRYTAYINGTLSFYNAYDEIESIKRSLSYPSLRTIEACDDLLEKDLSPEDIKLVESMRYTAVCRYNNTCYDASAEYSMCLSNLKSGNFYQAEQICTTTLQRNDLSFDDECIFEGLLIRAQGDINAANSGSGRISSNRAVQLIRSTIDPYYINYLGYVFNVYDLGDCYAVLAGVTRNANGTSYYFVFDDGSYKNITNGSDVPFVKYVLA